MSDPVDLAQAREAELLQDALAAQARRVSLTQTGAATCEDCGEAIPAARRAALPSARTCLGCQQGREHRNFRGVT